MTLQFTFVLHQDSSTDQLKAQLCLYNPTSNSINLAKLYFSLPRRLFKAAFSPSLILQHDGDLHCLTLNHQLPPNDRLTVDINQANTSILKYSDFPSGVYALDSEQNIISVLNNSVAPHFERLSSGTNIVPESLKKAFIPQPKTITIKDQSLYLRNLNTGQLNDAQQDLLALLCPTFMQHKDGIEIELSNTESPSLTLTVDEKQIHINGDLTMQARGLSLLAQTQNAQHNGLALNTMQIFDEANYVYRGCHLDCARHFFTPQQVKRFLLYMAANGFNYFHWHLSDDEAWRLELPGFPELTAIGAYRGHGLKLPPQMGSGAQSYGGFYSLADTQEIIQYAQQLGISIIPEIDLPGHCRALVLAYPEQLTDPEDQSQYLSVQHYSDNIITLGNPAALELCKAILTQVAKLFPGDAIHLGSDEVPQGAWLQSPMAQRYMTAHQLNSSADLHGFFLSQLEQHLQHLGKHAAGWEEIRTGDAVSTKTWVYSWQGEQSGQAAAQAGHPVVLCPAQSCYLDLAHSMAAHETGYYWAGTINLESAYTWEPIHSVNVIGIQACLWSELIDSQQTLEYMMFPRMFALAETAWNGIKKEPFEDFIFRANQQKQWLLNQNIYTHAF